MLALEARRMLMVLEFLVRLRGRKAFRQGNPLRSRPVTHASGPRGCPATNSSQCLCHRARVHRPRGMRRTTRVTTGDARLTNEVPATAVNGRRDDESRRSEVCSDLRLRLVGRGGVEPPTFHFSGGRSYQLSYLPKRPKLYNKARAIPESVRRRPAAPRPDMEGWPGAPQPLRPRPADRAHPGPDPCRDVRRPASRARRGPAPAR